MRKLSTRAEFLSMACGTLGAVTGSFVPPDVTALIERARSWRYATVVGWMVLGISAIVCIWSIKLWCDWQFSIAPPWSDWQTEANAVNRVLAHQPLYAPEQLSGPYYMTSVILRGWTYPPASIIPLLPFKDEPLGLYAWIVLNIGLFVGGLAAILRRELGRSFVPWPFAFVLFGLAAFRPFGEGVAAGNVNVALAGLYALCWASDERSRWIAPVAGIAATFKLFPGLMVLWAVRRQGFRPIVIAVGTFLALCLLSVPLVGVQTWRDFITTLVNARPPCQSYNTLSIACVYSQLTGVTVAKLIGYGFVAVFAVSTLLVKDRFWAFVLLGATMLAGVTDMHLHFWVFGYVVLVVGMTRVYARTRPQGAVRVSSSPWPQNSS